MISAPACSGICVDPFPLESAAPLPLAAAPLPLAAAAPLPIAAATLFLAAAAPLSLEAAAGAAACTPWRTALCGAFGMGFAGDGLAAATAAASVGAGFAGSAAANECVFLRADGCGGGDDDDVAIISVPV